MLRNAITVVCCVIGLAAFGATSHARALLHQPPARAPCSVLSGHPCHPSFTAPRFNNCVEGAYGIARFAQREAVESDEHAR